MRGQGKGKREEERRGLVALRIALVFSALLLFAFALARHPANVASSQIKVQPNGTFVAQIRFDIAAFVTGATPTKADDEAMNAFLDGSDDEIRTALKDAESRFRAGFGAQKDGALDKLAFPTLDDVRRYLASKPEPRLPMMLVVVAEGHLPAGARTVSFRYPAVVDTVIQTVEFPYREPFSEPVEANRSSTMLNIPTDAEIARLAAEMNAPRATTPAKQEKVKPAPVKKTVPISAPAFVVGKRQTVQKPTEKAVPTPVETKEAPKAVVAPEPAVPVEALKTAPSPKEILAAPVEQPDSLAPPPSPFLTYLRMGFTHILPEGLDHILFVLGLFLLGTDAKALLKQVTAFTVAHSITLALATMNVVRLPGRIIEPLIAVSIAFVAIENLTTKEVRPWRTAVVFLFGLVHGMGFAEVFHDAGLSGSGLITALLSFNVGVELGQLSVVGLALVAVGWFRKDPRYRRLVVVPGSLLIAGAALFWTFERTVGG